MTFDDLRAKYPRLLTGASFECQEGWIGILDDYFGVVDHEMPADATYELRQLKEKLGALRIYDYCSATDNDAIQGAHRLAEARSYHTCEQCGRPGVWSNRGGLLTTVCDEHAVDPVFGRAVPIESGGYTYSDSNGDWHRYDLDLDAFVPTEPPKWRE